MHIPLRPRLPRTGFGWWMTFVVTLAIAIIGTKGYIAYNAGCLESMILQGVCLSEPQIDQAVKDVLKN